MRSRWISGWLDGARPPATRDRSQPPSGSSDLGGYWVSRSWTGRATPCKCATARARLDSLAMASVGMSRTIRPQVTIPQAILTGWLLCGVLDITAACIQAWIQAGRTPAMVLKGVASALWGRAAFDAGGGMAAIGLAMHFTVALTATLLFYALSRRVAFLRTAPLLIVGPVYGLVVFAAMNYGTL